MDIGHWLYEAVEGIRFNTGIRGIDWLENKSFTASGAAVSYDYLFALVKILQHLKPENILEFGLGQSSKVLSAYNDTHKCTYTIVEHNKEWKDFFMEELKPCKDVNIHIVPLIHPIDEEFKVVVNRYSDIADIVSGNKFNLISIDGPFGSSRNSRIDILKYIPDCLGDSWCILLDDCSRIGEIDTIKKLKSILDKHNIKYHEHVYGQSKPFYMITSFNNLFLTSLF